MDVKTAWNKCPEKGVYAAKGLDSLRGKDALVRARRKQLAWFRLGLTNRVRQQDFVKLFASVPGVDAGLAASIFHFREVDIRDLKLRLKEAGIPVRL